MLQLINIDTIKGLDGSLYIPFVSCCSTDVRNVLRLISVLQSPIFHGCCAQYWLNLMYRGLTDGILFCGRCRQFLRCKTF